MFSKPLPLSLFYILSYILIFFANKFAPTNLAGPGLDMLAMGVFAVMAVVIFIISIASPRISKNQKTVLILIHLIGAVLFFVLINLPTDHNRFQLPF